MKKQKFVKKLCCALTVACSLALAACGGAKFNVTFDANGGTGAMLSVEIGKDGEFVVPESGFSAAVIAPWASA